MADAKSLLRKQFVAKNEIDPEERTITAVITTDTVDRDKEVLLPKGAKLEQYQKNPVVLWAHSYHETPIARTLWIKQGRKGITAKAQFAKTEKAEEIYQLYKGGFLNAFSIGFLPASDGFHDPTPDEIKKHPEWVNARRIFDNWELLEFSAVPVPANPDALSIAVKTKQISINPSLQKELGIEDEDDETTYTTYAYTIVADCKTNNDFAGKTFEEFIAAGCFEISKELVLKPYPNEHSCRLNDPDKYDRFARKNCEQKHDDKCIDVIYGIKEGKSEIQALRFSKDIWEASAAKSVCSARGGSFEAAKEIIAVEQIVEIPVALSVDSLTNISEQIRDQMDWLRGKI